jgi:hypothetical protein
MTIKYDLNKIKFGVDEAMFERAADLYEDGAVIDFQDSGDGFLAKVIGSEPKPYDVSVSSRFFDRGRCSCYMGRQDELCKHMIAVAMRAIADGKPLTQEEKQPVGIMVCSGRLGILNSNDLSAVKKNIAGALKYIKGYNGPSRVWFQYQNSLSEGCGRLAAIISELPVSKQTAKLLVDLLLRIDKKLCEGGVDDSDGTVGGFIENVVDVLKKYADLDNECLSTFDILKNRETCFGWEDPLLKLMKS